MSELIIAAQLFTVRELLQGKSEEEIKEVLSKVKNIGYKAIQISGVGEITPELGKTYEKVAKELDLKICATHFSLEYMEENTQWIVDIHKKWQCSYAGIGSMPEHLRTENGLMEFVDRCNELGKRLKKEGIQLIYHNHKFEFEKMDGKPWLQILLDKFNPEYVQLELDVYWVQAGGANPVTWINKVADKMGIMHFKDMRIVDDEQRFAEIGQGNLEWMDIIEASRNANVCYAAVEQDRHTEDPMESLKISYDFIKKLLYNY